MNQPVTLEQALCIKIMNLKQSKELFWWPGFTGTDNKDVMVSRRVIV
jgi:hypothetical protein